MLFHVTANPAWSSLPLSGLYVDMLRRLLDLASGGRRRANCGADANAVFPPVSTLDGFGRLQKRTGGCAADPCARRHGETKPSAAHPPGLYGAAGSEIALNAVNADTVLTPLSDAGVTARPYCGTAAKALQRRCSRWRCCCLLTRCADLACAARLSCQCAALALAAGTVGRFCCSRRAAVRPRARTPTTPFDMKAALDTRLAYVITGVPDVDDMSNAGLDGPRRSF